MYPAYYLLSIYTCVVFIWFIHLASWQKNNFLNKYFSVIITCTRICFQYSIITLLLKLSKDVHSLTCVIICWCSLCGSLAQTLTDDWQLIKRGIIEQLYVCSYWAYFIKCVICPFSCGLIFALLQQEKLQLWPNEYVFINCVCCLFAFMYHFR